MKWLLLVIGALICGQSVVAAPHVTPKSSSAAAPAGLVPRTMNFPPVGTLTVYVPKVVDENTDVILFASGDGEWNQGVIDMAEPIAGLGKIVVGFSTPEYLKRLDASKQKCAYPPQELEALSQFVQRELGIKHYRAPLLVGYSSGATLVYVALAQAPINAFTGGIDLGFCPEIVMKKPLCRQGALMEPLKAHKNMDPNAGDNTNVFALYPVKHFAAPLQVLQGGIDEVCTVKSVEPFIASADNATLTTVDKVGHGFAVQDHWFSKFVTADKTIDAQYVADDPLDDPVVADLPLIERPAASTQSTFVVMFSGDGGWSTLTQKVAAELNADGNPVVGWNTLKYFWNPKTPVTAGADLGRVIEHYAQEWHKHGVVLIGYSMGADVLPAIVNRLPAASRQRVRSVVLLAPVRAASFEFHLTGWLNHQASDAVPIKPEVDRLAPIPITCIYGTDEAAMSLCTQLSGANITVKPLPGAHHFDRDYKELAQLVLNAPIPETPENPAGTDGFEFVEYAAPDPQLLRGLFTRMGFPAVARHRSKNVTLHKQGDINFIINAEPDSFAQQFAKQHGPCACAMAFRVKDARQALARVTRLGATVCPGNPGPMELNIPAIEGIGGSRLYLVDRYGDDTIYDIDFTFEPNWQQEMQRRSTGLQYIDHLTHNVKRGRMSTWATFYEALFGFREIRYFDIEGTLTGLVSKAMTSPCGKIRIPLNESQDDRSQVEEFLKDYHGEGIQHIALGSRDIYRSVDQLLAAGVALQDTPDTYYDGIDARVPGHGESVDALRQRRILIDGAPADGQGVLLQIFTRNVIGPIFFEIIQRKGNDGFGEGNFRALFESIERDQIERGVLDADRKPDDD